MAHKHGRIDLNQKVIVKTLRAIGATVQSLADIGKGCPDILVGHAGRNYLLEIKDGTKSKLTEHEEEWHDEWRGDVKVVRTVDEALIAIHAISGKDVKGARHNH